MFTLDIPPMLLFPLQAQILELSGAYFIYDLIICLLDASTRDVSMSVHHFVTLLGVIWGLKAQTVSVLRCK
jgi:hypothetical protein